MNCECKHQKSKLAHQSKTLGLKKKKLSIFNDEKFSSVYSLFFILHIQYVYSRITGVVTIVIFKALKTQLTDHSWFNFNE